MWASVADASADEPKEVNFRKNKKHKDGNKLEGSTIFVRNSCTVFCLKPKVGDSPSTS